MADTAFQTDIFKFVALRPPVPVDGKDQETGYIKDNREPARTPAGQLIKTFTPENADKIPTRIKEWIKEKGYDPNGPGGENSSLLMKIYELAKSKKKDDFNSQAFIDEVNNLLGTKVDAYINKPEIKSWLDEIWDHYYAFYLLARTEPVNLDALTSYLRAFHLLKNVGSHLDFDKLQSLLSAKPLVAKLFTDLPKPLPKKEDPAPGISEVQKKEYTTLWKDLVDTHRAIDELKGLKVDNKISSETKDITNTDKQTGGEIKTKLTFAKNKISINAKSLEKLHVATKSILQNFDVAEQFQVAEPVMQLQTKLQNLYARASQIEDPKFLDFMPEEAKGIAGLFPIITVKIPPVILLPAPTNVRSLIKPLGVGDLKVVKQTLKKYVAGEVAHIENVLKGEYKERKHRELDRTEDIFTVSSETDEETTKDTQTTDRFELKKESEKTIQEQMSVQAGVTVSGSYGMVTFGAHGDFAYSTASTESNKSSSNFAREVVDRSVSKIQKKTKEERTTKKLHEVEEINTHGIDNKDKPDHVRGLYRWVDKYYEAQIYNYGRRMMFEFVIPEPAAFFEFAQTHKPKKDIVAPKPLPTGLTHKNITEYNYQNFIRDYNIQGVLTPPPQFKVVSVILSSDANIQNGTALSKSSKELVVPEGYIFNNLSFSLSAIYENYPQLKLSIGSNDLGWATLSNNSARRRWDFTAGSISNYDSIIPVSINCYDINSFFVNVSVNCLRTDEKYEQWQIQTFEKIMAAYKAMQMEYEQKIAAQETMEGIAIQGQNPRINREIEKIELKKQCVKMLMDTYLFGSFDAMKDGGSNPPDFDVFDAFDEGKTVQFFEQAFEWENITYLFYPYFWARKTQWMHKSTIFDADPLFTQFLQAGSARVVLPVHPAYNDAIMYFLENNGAIWKGGEPPRLNDPMFISIAEELKDQTDDLAGAKPEGEPWQVILPTTLVYLQTDSELPTY